MAETVYLNDGTVEYIFDEKDVFLERLIREKLGDDAAHCFREYADELMEEAKSWETQAVDNERIADGYLQMCHNARETFYQLDAMVRSPRLNKSALQKLITEGYQELHNNL